MIRNIFKKKNSFALSKENLKRVKAHLHTWGISEEVIEKYNTGSLLDHIAKWEEFVEFDWKFDWYPEYYHDIGVRNMIQLAIESVDERTKKQLEELTSKADQSFKERMQPLWEPFRRPTHPGRNPYFWEEHTLLQPEEKSEVNSQNKLDN